MSSVSASADLQDLWSILLSRLSLGDRPFQGGSACGTQKAIGDFQAIPPQLSARQAYTIVKAGIPSRSLTHLSRYLGLGKGTVANYLGLDRATAARKEARDEALPSYAAESMLRMLELDSIATATFETHEKASRWMRQPHPMLDGESPLQCATSGFGAQCAKDILVAIKYGGVV